MCSFVTTEKSLPHWTDNLLGGCSFVDVVAAGDENLAFRQDLLSGSSAGTALLQILLFCRFYGCGSELGIPCSPQIVANHSSTSG
jgi:hypothetical protein